MPEPIHNKHGVTRILVLAGILLSGVMSMAYLIQPAFITSTNKRTIDVLMNLAPVKAASGKVAIVDIDDKSLARYGQWPWPRNRLAQLLGMVQASGAATIALDLILAEPDRTSPRSFRNDTGTDTLVTSRVPQGGMLDHDRILADTLAKGPFVLGYQFLFRGDRESETRCELHPASVVWIERVDAVEEQSSLFAAQGAVCNLPMFSEAVTHSGFLNATPDADGVLRRVPMLIRFGDHLHPSLALAALMRYSKSSQIEIRRRESSGSLKFSVGNRSFSVDNQGNMIVRFSSRGEAIPRVSAGDLLGGHLFPEKLKDKIVLVGSSAAGLEPAYQTSIRRVHTHSEIHAEVLDNLLAGQRVIRTARFRVWEVLIGLLVAACTGLTVARMRILPSAAVSATLLVGCWIGMRLTFQAWGYLFSPLFPTVMVVLNYTVLTIFKTWKVQLVVREFADSTLVRLKSTEETMDSIVKAVPDIIFRLDPAGRLTFISPAIAKYTSSRDALLEKPILPLIKNEYRDAFVKLSEDAFQGVSGNLEFEAIGFEGGHVWLDTHVVPFRNDAGEIVSLLGVARDVTDRKIAEIALAEKQLLLEELNLHLEQRVENAVSDLREKDRILIQQGRQAAMGEMIGNIAHQWRQPLNTLGLIVQELRLTYGRQEFNKEYLDASIRKAMGLISHMSRTIEDFRNYFKPDKQKMPFNVNKVVEKTLSLVEPSLKSLGIDIEVFEMDVVDINGYEHEYSQVLLNILLNCRDAFEGGKTAGRRCIGITVFKEADASVITVSDNAGGIPEGVLDKIFDPYFTTKGPDKGTGIGLYMAKTIIEKNMGGRLTARNTAEGAEFRIEVYSPG